MSPRRGGGRLVYIPGENVPQEPAERLPEAILGCPLEDLPMCNAGCGRRVLRRAAYRTLSEEDRKVLQSLNVRRVEAKGICGGCYPQACKSGLILQFEGYRSSPPPIKEQFDIPALWEKVRESGGSSAELGAELGVSREYARQLVKELGLPRWDGRHDRSIERDLFISEAERLVRFGIGLHEIAGRFSLTEDQFIEKIGRLRERGLTELRFDTYLEVAA